MTCGWLPSDTATPERWTRLGETSASGGVGSLTWTPDSSAVLFTLGGELFRTDGGDVESLGIDGAYALSFSPDGKWLAFFEER